jgi:hypothetical protein
VAGADRTEVPANAQPIRRDFHKPSLRADVLEEHHQLQAKENYRIYAGAPNDNVAVGHQFLTNERLSRSSMQQ